MPRRCATVWICVGMALAGCGGTKAVTATVDVTAPVTGQELFGFTGNVVPRDSEVTAQVVGGAAGSVVVEPSGRFSVGVGGLRRGRNVVRLRATRDGRRVWTREIRVTRGHAPVVAVPARDTEPPVAVLRLGPGRLSVSPSAPRDRHQHVVLRQPRFRATALVRDDGGAGRIRFSTTYATRCGSTVRPRHVSFPPAQIVNVRLAPGARVPVEETREVTLRLPDRRGCRVTGEAWAEATDGQGLQAVTRHIAFSYRAAP